MKQEIVNIRLTYTEQALAVSPGDLNLLGTHLTTKIAPEIAKEEMDAMAATLEDVEEQIEKQSTIFFKDDLGIYWWNYQLKGFFKEQYKTLIELNELKGSKWTAAKCIDNCVFVSPRRLYIHDPDGHRLEKPHGQLTRTIRVNTLRGERVAISRSEYVNAGCYVDAAVEILTRDVTGKSWATFDHDAFVKCLDFGARKGFSQWRSAGFGTFTYQILDNVGPKKAEQDMNGAEQEQ